jgi:two-component system response regulator YesN
VKESGYPLQHMGNRRKYQFLKYALTYIVVLILPIMSFLIYFRVEQVSILREKLDEQLQAEIQEVGVALKIEFEELTEIAVLIDRSDDFLPFKLSNSMDLVFAHKLLARIESVNDFIVDIAYIPNNAERIYTVNGPLFPGTYFELISDNDPVVAEELRTQVAETGSPRFLKATSNTKSETILFATGIPINSPAKRGTIVFEVNSSYLSRLMIAGLPARGPSAIVLVEKDATNSVSSGRTMYSVRRDSESIDFENIANDDLDFADYSIDSVQLVLRLIVDRRQAYDEIYSSLISLLLITAFVLLASFPLIYLFAFSNHSLLHKLFSFLQKTFKDEEISGDVMDYAESRITRLKDDRDRFSEEIDKAESFVKRELLVHIVNGSVDNWVSVKSQCERHGIDLAFRSCRILILTPEFSCLESDTTRLMALLDTALQGKGKIYGFMDLREGDFVLIATDVESSELSSPLNEYANLLKQHYNCEWSISVSSVVSHFLDIPRGYIEAKSTQEHRFVLGFDKVLFSEGVLNRELGRTAYPANMIDRLYSFARDKNLEQITREISNLFVEIQTENLSLFFARSVSYNVIMALIFALSEGTAEPLNIWDYAGVINLSSIRTFPEMEQVLLKVSTDLMSLAQDSGNRDEVYLSSFDYIIEYVVSRCFEPSLAAKGVANTFGLSLSNFSHQFKRKTGKTFRALVQEIRLQEAKRLLRDTDITVNEIVDKIGFLHPNSFIKCFKREVGSTPIEYRKRFAKNGSHPQFDLVQSN